MARKAVKTRATKTKTKKKTRKAPRGVRAAAAADGLVQSWPTDPMGGLQPVQVAAPAMPGARLATRIIEPAQAPPAAVHAIGTAEFRYWTAAEALRRCAAFWAAAGVTTWHGNVGSSLPVRLDDGIDLNAYYARDPFPVQDIKQGLSFFHDTVRDVATGRRVTVFSGESPDVVSHEVGHAVLDTLKPALWGIASTEHAAFHESFGDMSAILTALQLPSVRQAVLEETSGTLRRNSSVSRVAEQLGFAIRQRSPSAVDPDSLRNAANSFVYVDPLTLPTSGPASGLNQAPHNFSRVFTGAFLEALGGMVTKRAARPREGDVQQASQDMGQLLARAVRNAPVRTRFFQAVAEQMVLADSALFQGRYADALTTAFVRRGLMAVRSLAAPDAVTAGSLPKAAAAAARFAAIRAGGVDASGVAAAGAAQPVRIAIDGTTLGLPVSTVYVDAPTADDVGHPGPAAVAMAGVDPTVSRRLSAVQAFVEGLVVRGRVAVARRTGARTALVGGLTHRRLTHQLVPGRDGVELQRLTFECC
jgi:hypothetical protein